MQSQETHNLNSFQKRNLSLVESLNQFQIIPLMSALSDRPHRLFFYFLLFTASSFWGASTTGHCFIDKRLSDNHHWRLFTLSLCLVTWHRTLFLGSMSSIRDMIDTRSEITEDYHYQFTRRINTECHRSPGYLGIQ